MAITDRDKEPGLGLCAEAGHRRGEATWQGGRDPLSAPHEGAEWG